MKKILVPVDFSEHSEHAMEVAAMIAKKQQAEIVVIHMLGLSEAVLNNDEAREVMEAMYYMKLAQKRFVEFLDKDYLKGLKVTDMVHNYKVFSELNDIAQEQKVDLIVMGSHGSSGLSEIFVGSNTEKVVRNSEIPVLVIKNKIKDFQFENIVYGFDFDLKAVKTYRKAMKFFALFNAKVNLLYVNLPAERFRSTAEMEDRVREFLFEADHGSFDNLENVVYRANYSVEEGIYSYCKMINADVVAVSTHGRRGLSHFFFGSIGEDIANHSDIPVITFKI
jgi:nucleotide-binding universal stress UspA family protein